jgi:hypothetical protein
MQNWVLLLLTTLQLSCASHGSFPTPSPEQSVIEWTPAALRVRGLVLDSAGIAVVKAGIGYFPCPYKQVPRCEDSGRNGGYTDSAGRFSFLVESQGEYMLVAALASGLVFRDSLIVLPRDSASVVVIRVRRCAVIDNCRP